jgi:hypothetical protein
MSDKQRLSPHLDDIRRRLADPSTRLAAAVEIGDWARDICLIFGSQLDTAYFVGGTFARGLEREWSKSDAHS